MVTKKNNSKEPIKLGARFTMCNGRNYTEILELSNVSSLIDFHYFLIKKTGVFYVR